MRGKRRTSMHDGKQILDKIHDVVGGVAHRETFEPLRDEAGERHGSWEITYFKRSQGDKDPHRFVSVSFTAAPSEAFSEGDLEIWEIAEMEPKFTRKRVATIPATKREVLGGAVDAKLQARFQDAIERVNRTGMADLTESYEVRPKRGWSAVAA
jgi:hypothetical protein